MIGFEFKKVISNTRIIFLTSFLFLLNIVLIACQIFLPNKDGYSERDVNRIYREMGDNQASYISQQISSLVTPGTSITEENIEDIMTSLSLYMFVETEVAQINSYSDYLDSISSVADRMQGASLLFQEDSFSARNIADISDKYSTLTVTPTRWVPSSGLSLLTENVIIDAFILLVLSFSILSLTAEERSVGYHRLINIIPGGCQKNWLSKWITILLICLISIFAFYGPCYLMSRFLVGWGNGSHPLQSTVAYFKCPYELSISEYIYIFFFAKTLVLFVIVTIIYCLSCYFADNLTAITVIFLPFIISLIMWNTVTSSSWFGILKEFNLFALLNINHYFNDVINVNVVGYPIPTASVGISLLLITCTLSIPLSKSLWGKPTATERKSTVLNYFRSTNRISTNLYVHEVRKFLLTNKGLLICCLMLMLLVFGISLIPNITQEQYYYQQYANTLRGDLSEGKTSYIKAESERIAQANEEIAALSEKVSSGELSLDAFAILSEQIRIPTAQQIAFSQVEKQYSTLLVQYDNGHSVRFIDESGWKLLSSDWGKMIDIIGAAWISVLFTLCIFNFGSMETESGMNVLFNTCPEGVNRVFRTKKNLVRSLGFLASFLIYGSKLTMVNSVFPTEELFSSSVPICSLTVIEEQFAGLPILMYVVICFLSGVTEAIAVAEGMLYLSYKVKSSLASFFSCMLIPIASFAVMPLLQIQPLMCGRKTISSSLIVIGLGLLVSFGSRKVGISKR